MKKKYEVGMNQTGEGGKYYCEVRFNVEAENEFMAIKEAERQEPRRKVCFIEEK